MSICLHLSKPFDFDCFGIQEIVSLVSVCYLFMYLVFLTGALVVPVGLSPEDRDKREMNPESATRPKAVDQIQDEHVGEIRVSHVGPEGNRHSINPVM